MNEFTWEEQASDGCEKGRHMYILYQCTEDSWCASCKDYHPESVGAVQKFARGTYWRAHHWSEHNKNEVMVLPTREEAQAWLLTVARMS